MLLPMPQALYSFVARAFSCLSRVRESDLRPSGSLSGTQSRSQYVKSEETADWRRKAFRRLAAKIPTRSSMQRQAIDHDQSSKLARSSAR